MNHTATVNTIRYGSTCILALSLLLSGGCAKTIADKKSTPEKSSDPAKKSTPEKASAPAKKSSIDLGKGQNMKLVLIPAGKFMMGSKFSVKETMSRYGGKPQHLSCEHPYHEVTISKPFYMGVYEVTQAEWKALMGTEPWKDKTQTKAGDKYPASWMTSYQAIEFCKVLSKKTGRKVSLPTEAQWEYACRGGATTAYCYGDDPKKIVDYAWCWLNTRKANPPQIYAHLVGTKKPNAWGLYDMHGNLWEYCSDWYDKDYYARSPKVDPENTTETKLRSVRGGSWHNGSREARSTMRSSWTGPKYVHYNYGFRVVVQP
jgi:formylglycine-generating enzyme required for sulfatase activity